MRRRKTRQRNKRLAERRRGQRQPDPSRIPIHRTAPMSGSASPISAIVKRTRDRAADEREIDAEIARWDADAP